MTAVRKDGRWYLSLFYTAAEGARAETGEDIPAEGITPTGGDSPEAAMDAFLDGVEGLDLSAVIASLNPNEFEALQRYAPLFIDEAQSSLDDVDVTMSISDRDYEVTGSGDTRSVTVGAITFDVSAEGESVSMELRDGCWIVSSSSGQDDMNSCEVADSMPQLDEVLDDPQPSRTCWSRSRPRSTTTSTPASSPRRSTGAGTSARWRPGSEQVLAVVRALSREEIEQLQQQITDVVGSIDEDVLSGELDIPTLDDFERPDGDEGSVTTLGEPSPTTTCRPTTRWTANRRPATSRSRPTRGGLLPRERRHGRVGVLRPDRGRRRDRGVGGADLPAPPGVRPGRPRLERRLLLPLATPTSSSPSRPPRRASKPWSTRREI